MIELKIQVGEVSNLRQRWTDAVIGLTVAGDTPDERSGRVIWDRMQRKVFCMSRRLWCSLMIST